MYRTVHRQKQGSNRNEAMACLPRRLGPPRNLTHYPLALLHLLRRAHSGNSTGLQIQAEVSFPCRFFLLAALAVLVFFMPVFLSVCALSASITWERIASRRETGLLIPSVTDGARCQQGGWKEISSLLLLKGHVCVPFLATTEPLTSKLNSQEYLHYKGPDLHVDAR